MGYQSSIALHTKGKAAKFLGAQNEYFESLKTAPVKLWGGAGFHFSESETLLETRESYVKFGKHIWEELSFKPVNGHVYGEMFWREIKWRYYFGHQCKLLRKALTKHGYSWYFIHVGQVDKDTYMANNAKEIEDFDYSVFKRYIIDHYYDTPLLKKG